MASPWTYAAWDLLSWEPLDSLPYAGVSFGETVNSPGSFSGTLAITDPRVQKFDWADATRTGRTAVFVDFAGSLVWGGIIWTRQWDEFSTPQTLKIGAMTFGSYLQQRLQAGDYTVPPGSGTYWQTSPWDPTLIAMQLVSDAFAKTGGSIAGGITLLINGNPPQTVASFTTPATGVTNNGSPQLLFSGFTYTGPWPTPGMTISVAGVPGGTTVLDVGVASNTIYVLMSANATATATGLAVTFIPSGTTVVPIGDYLTISYPGTQLQTLGSIFATLSAMGFTYGFDFSFDCAYVPGTTTPAVTLNIWYPRQGQTAALSELVIMHHDLIGFTYDEDSTKQADAMFETGAGGGGIQPEYAYVPDIITAGYPLLEAVKSRTQVNNQGLLTNITTGDLALLCWPVTTPTLTIPVALPDPVNFPDQPGNINPAQITFGNFNLGDDLLHIIDPAPVDANGVASFGPQNSPRFPQGYTFEWRITAWNCTASDSGQSSITFDLGTPPQEALPPPEPPE